MSDLMTREQWYALAQKALSERDEAYCDTDALRTDLAAATSRAEQAEEAVLFAKGEGQTLGNRIVLLTTERDQLESDLAAARGERDRLQARIAALEAEVAALKYALAEAKAAARSIWEATGP